MRLSGILVGMIAKSIKSLRWRWTYRGLRFGLFIFLAVYVWDKARPERSLLHSPEITAQAYLAIAAGWLLACGLIGFGWGYFPRKVRQCRIKSYFENVQ